LGRIREDFTEEERFMLSYVMTKSKAISREGYWGDAYAAYIRTAGETK
jgi:hypothetical protein